MSGSEERRLLTRWQSGGLLMDQDRGRAAENADVTSSGSLCCSEDCLTSPAVDDTACTARASAILCFQEQIS